MRGKRAQSAVEVSVLVFLIAVGIIGYIILLPVEDRASLLGTETGTSTAGTNVETATTLLSESPGKVNSAKSLSQVRNLEPIRLYSNTESVNTVLSSSLSVSRSIFQNNYKTISFDIDNFAVLQKAQLLFLITDSQGKMTVMLNGHTLFEGELTGNELPLELPRSYLVEKGNVLTLSTNLGWNLFSPNYYLLQDIQLLEGYTVADTVSTRSFSVDEPSQVSGAVLNYFITCNSDEDGILTISLNNREAFSDRVFCQYLNQRELALNEDYLANSNTLKFEITKGDYNIEEVGVTIKSKTKDYPSFSFDVDSDLYEQISSGEKDIYLSLSFSDDVSEKEATVLVQQYSFTFDTESDSYEKKISSYVDDGANTITLQPGTDFEIDNLKVYVA